MSHIVILRTLHLESVMHRYLNNDQTT
jgi:hypothetical protein